jgi:hypothetical protein
VGRLYQNPRLEGPLCDSHAAYRDRTRDMLLPSCPAFSAPTLETKKQPLKKSSCSNHIKM